MCQATQTACTLPKNEVAKANTTFTFYKKFLQSTCALYLVLYAVPLRVLLA